VSSEGKFLDAAKRAVADACKVCRAVQHDSGSIEKELKDDRSPVTVADYASQAVVIHRLREELGEVHCVGEEDAGSLRSPEAEPLRQSVVAAARLVWTDASEDEVLDAIDGGNDPGDRDNFWTLDPIDGTKGFLRGEQYAVSLSYIEGHVPALGVLGCPNLPMDFSRPFDTPDGHGAIYVASRNYGLYEVAADEAAGHLRRVPSLQHEESDAVRVCESVESAHSKHDHTVQIMEKLGADTISLRLDSQAKYAVVARGQADAYLRMPTRPGYRERIWDHAAGALCASEGGALVTDITGKRLDFSKGTTLADNRGIVCATPKIHARIIEAIAELGFAEMGTD
jgi:3'(2'), 5'-bisphosphate nucleotidase